MRAGQVLHRAVAVLALGLPLLALAGGAEGKGKRPAPTPWTGPVPRAECGPNDHTESGLQGQTTVAERFSGDSMRAYTCNLELVGQFQGEGSKYMMAWFDDCAYYGTDDNPEQQRRGTVAVDASDPRNPRPTAYLDTPTMLDPHESLEVHEKRKLLAGVEFQGMGFAIYDVSADCRRPVLKASIELHESHGHAGSFTPDGLTYYSGSDSGAPGGRHFFAIDVTDSSNPKEILRWPPPGNSIGVPHDLSISEDGTRAYLAKSGRPPGDPVGPTGLVIVDVSDIQFRRPNPQVSIISTLFWEDGTFGQQTLPVTYHGRPHLVFTDEAGAYGMSATSTAAACAAGLAPFGIARIIDISDERNPRVISKLMLEVSDPTSCPMVLNDPSPNNYSAHYCNVDKKENPKMLACTYRDAGLRVFDIRNPFQPKEIAYYKPPAQRTAFLPGSALWVPGRDRTVDHTPTQVRWRKHRGETQLWFASQDNGFQIVRFTKPMHELLGPERPDKSGKPK